MIEFFDFSGVRPSADRSPDKTILKACIEILERLARLQCPMGYPTHDADEVACPVLEFRNDRPETLLALAQRHGETSAELSMKKDQRGGSSKVAAAARRKPRQR